ncbi:hypothetical protein N8I77_008397 [Diaporthe amygdali]|uniref:Uncharacterized protein n=1 Tax=Phomopsis amygdali TaxID=1214568 RepID=A0AAD9SEW7_PHOAM|nr:hypothetical protein N8I77_008397 [Diaporthe amygdali]
MRFSAIQGIALALVGLAKAQCFYDLVDVPNIIPIQPRHIFLMFEDLPNAPALGVGIGSSPIPDGYSSLNWTNLYGATTSITAQFPLPQGKMHFIFAGIFLRNLLGGATALSSASTITVTANFSDSTTAQTTFNIDPPDTVFGLSVGAQALQYFKFPCVWTEVVSLSFSPQAELGVDTGLGLAIDNFQYTIPLERV